MKLPGYCYECYKAKCNCPTGFAIPMHFCSLGWFQGIRSVNLYTGKYKGKLDPLDHFVENLGITLEVQLYGRTSQDQMTTDYYFLFLYKIGKKKGASTRVRQVLQDLYKDVL